MAERFIDIWRPTRIAVNQAMRGRIGPLTLWLRRTPLEWHLAARRAAEEDAAGNSNSDEAEPQAATWLRWTAGDEASIFRFLPAMPDRPVVVRPEARLAVPPNRQEVLFVSIPVWVRITVGADSALLLREEPTVEMSPTWFGDRVSGELCYALRTRARCTIVQAEAREHRAVCPVRVQNAWSAPLEFERLCIQVADLSVYSAATQLWTNEVRVTFRGPHEPSQVDIADGAPAIEPITGILGGPRTPMTRSMLRRSFAGLWAADHS